MSDLLPNRAAARAHEQTQLWHRPAFLEPGAADQLAVGFVREDRRRLVGVPGPMDGPMDGPTYIEQQKTWSQLGHGPHSLHIDEVIGYRGDRLVAVRLRIAFEDGFAIEVLAVQQYNEAVLRNERMVVFDADDVEAALGELDRLSDEIE